MSTATIEINEIVYTLEVETATSNSTSTLEIESSSSQILEVNSGYAGNVVYASDIVGLDNYLANFIDNYDIDCGTP
jgi:hypothetical protein